MRPVGPLRSALLGGAVVVAAALAVSAGGTGAGSGRGAGDSIPIQITLFPTSTAVSTTTTVPTTTTTVARSTTTTAPPPTATTTTAPPTATTSAASGGIGAGLSPCSPPTAGAPCGVAPRIVEVSYPAGPEPPGFELSWVASPSRPAKAPQPQAASTVLQPAGQTACPTGATAAGGSDLACWAWPDAERDGAFVLNGAYDVTACDSVTNDQCTPKSGAQPVELDVAAPPSPPTAAGASVSGPEVTVSWKASAAPEPDLVGYLVTRTGQKVYSCTVPAMADRAAPDTCGPSLVAADNPGGGLWSYQVSAVRLGAGSGASALVASPGNAAQTPLVTVSGPVKQAGVTGSGAASLPVVPLAAAFPGVVKTPAAAGPAVAAGGFAPEEGALPGGPVQNLQYPGSDSPVIGSRTEVVATTAPAGHGVMPAGLVAVGMLVLALASAAVYLRTRLALLQRAKERD